MQQKYQVAIQFKHCPFVPVKYFSKMLIFLYLTDNWDRVQIMKNKFNKQ